VAFYELFGFEHRQRLEVTDPVEGGAPASIVMMGLPDEGATLELRQEAGSGPQDPGTGYYHFGLVVDDLEDILDRLDSVGIAPTMAPKRVTADTRVCFVRDPDGYKVEMLAPARSRSSHRK